MNKKASVLIISLWVLVILTMLAVSTGHRVSMGLRLSRYQQDRLKAFCLAKAAINKAIVELENDGENTSYDAPDESWADNKELFKNITLEDNPNEFAFATVSYEDIDEIYGSKTRTIYGIIDEERKININTASDKLIIALLQGCGLKDTPPEEVARYIRIWRGDDDPSLNAGEEKYASFKKASFTNIEELVAVLEHFFKNSGEKDYQDKAQEVFQNIKGFITSHSLSGSAKINANTASRAILTILANSVAKDQSEKDCVDTVVNEIFRQREEKKYFTTLNDIVISDDLVGGITSDIDLFNNGLKPNLTVTSNYFKIETQGHSNRITKKISAIYNRPEHKICYWHEK